jgi:transcriptional regulator with XRE-family HTH domain
MLGPMPRAKTPPTEFGARLVALRKTRNMTQIDLALAINSTQRAISYYEAEGGNPDLAVVVQLATALGVSTDELLGVKPLPPPQPVPATDPEERRFWRRFQQVMRLPEKDQRAVFRTIDTMARAGNPQRST